MNDKHYGKAKKTLLAALTATTILATLSTGSTPAVASQELFSEPVVKHCIIKNSNMHFIVSATKTVTILDDGSSLTDFTLDKVETLGWVKKKTIKTKNIVGVVLRVKARQKHTNRRVVCDLDIWSKREIFYGMFLK